MKTAVNGFKKRTYGQIMETHEYGAFKLNTTNRPIKPGHVKKLIKSMQKKYLVKPIEVNTRMEILDGQHRYTAAKHLMLPIRYIIVGNVTMDDVPEMNNLTSRWSVKDYLHSHKQAGIEDYKIFDEFISQYPEIPHTTAISLLAGEEGRKKSLEEDFMKGAFRVKTLKSAIDTAEFIKKIGEVHKGTYRKTFLSALLTIMQNSEFEKERFLRKLEHKHLLLREYSKEKEFIQVMEEMYNWKEPKKVRFY